MLYICDVCENIVPLHPLLRTNASSRMQRHKKASKKEFFEKITINREVVVQEAGFTYVIISRKGTEYKSEVWVEQMKPVNSQVPDSRLGRQILETF